MLLMTQSSITMTQIFYNYDTIYDTIYETIFYNYDTNFIEVSSVDISKAFDLSEFAYWYL